MNNLKDKLYIEEIDKIDYIEVVIFNKENKIKQDSACFVKATGNQYYAFKNITLLLLSINNTDTLGQVREKLKEYYPRKQDALEKLDWIKGEKRIKENLVGYSYKNHLPCIYFSTNDSDKNVTIDFINHFNQDHQTLILSKKDFIALGEILKALEEVE
jgi:hypothetical protein